MISVIPAPDQLFPTSCLSLGATLGAVYFLPFLYFPYFLLQQVADSTSWRPLEAKLVITAGASGLKADKDTHGIHIYSKIR